MPRPTYSLVVPIYNEEAVLPLLLRRLDRLADEVDGPMEIILVDDGSRDSGSIVLEARAKSDRRYRYIALSRNFGHQIAISTGLDAARGDAVIVIDADLQDPPELVHLLIEQWKAGFQIVSAQRRSRDGESRFKTMSAALFYRVLSRLASVEIPRNVGDCRLIDRKALLSFRSMRERERFVRGMMAWLGFRHAIVSYDREQRAAGDSKYSLAKMVRLAVDGLVSFSEAPLRWALWLGSAVSGVAILYGLYAIALWFVHGEGLVPGWSSTIVAVAFVGGANLLMTGIMGLYVGRIYSEVKGRPLYVIDRMVGFDAEVTAQSLPVEHAAMPFAGR